MDPLPASSSREPALRYFLTNCFVAGSERTRRNGGWIRNKICVNLDGFALQILQHAEVIGSDWHRLKGTNSVTTDVVIEGVGKRRLLAAQRVVENVAWLLRLACLSPVALHGYEYPMGSGLGVRHTVGGQGSYFRPTLDIRDGDRVRAFLEDTYSAFTHHDRPRRLRAVIDYLVHAERDGQPLEVQLLLLFVALECLKDTFARAEGIPYLHGRYRKRPKPPTGSDAYGFAELLRLMMKRVGMTGRLRQIVDLRNEIVHSGISRKTYAWQTRTYERCYDLIQEYVLRLLEYSGPWCPYSSPNSERTIQKGRTSRSKRRRPRDDSVKRDGEVPAAAPER